MEFFDKFRYVTVLEPISDDYKHVKNSLTAFSSLWHTPNEVREIGVQLSVFYVNEINVLNNTFTLTHEVALFWSPTREEVQAYFEESKSTAAPKIILFNAIKDSKEVVREPALCVDPMRKEIYFYTKYQHKTTFDADFDVSSFPVMPSLSDIRNDIALSLT